MTPALFILIPSGVTLLYVVGQFIAYAMRGRMYFSSTFGLEVAIYLLLGLLYVLLAFYIDRSKYLRLSFFGVSLGAVLFLCAGLTLFMTFEFGRDLSI
jgi:hypothetical protein